MSYLVCRRCGGHKGINDAETVSSEIDPGWMAIVCHECGIIACRARLNPEHEPEVHSVVLRGELCINVEAKQDAIREAGRMAKRAMRSHDRHRGKQINRAGARDPRDWRKVQRA